MTFNAGTVPSAEDWADANRRVIARGTRTTSTGTTTTTETGALRLDDIPLTGGRLYRITVSNLLMDSTVNSDGMAVRVRATMDGSTPTTSSTLLTSVVVDGTQSAGQAVVGAVRDYDPASDETLSLLLTFARVAGTGSVNLTAIIGHPIQMVVEDLGPDPGDTGVDI